MGDGSQGGCGSCEPQHGHRRGRDTVVSGLTTKGSARPACAAISDRNVSSAESACSGVRTAVWGAAATASRSASPVTARRRLAGAAEGATGHRPGRRGHGDDRCVGVPEVVADHGDGEPRARDGDGADGGTLAWLGALTLLWAALVWLSPEGACLVFPPISTRPSRPTPRGSAAAR